MSAHTPGLKHRFSCGCEARAGIESISLVQCSKHAAAPELLEALEEILDYRGGADSALDDEYVMDRARAALAKARGER